MRHRRVLVAGYGAIGQKVIAQLHAAKGYELAAIRRNASDQALPDGVRLFLSIDQIEDFAPDLIVEAAGQTFVRTYAADWLRAGIDVLISSVGVLCDAALRDELEKAALQGGATLLIPSGALAGVDYVHSVGALPGTRIQYESRKPLAAWQDELERLHLHDDAGKGAVTLYEGDAEGAAARYPANLNVAATLALAAGGFDRVDVKVVADKDAKGNTHLISVAGPVGTMRVEVVNAPAPDNPKTSMLVAFSITRAIKNYFSPIRMV